MPADDAPVLDSHELGGVELDSWNTEDWLDNESASVALGLND